MNKVIRFLAGSFLAVVLVLGLFPMQVQAASDRVYTVAIRSGNCGTFNAAAVKSIFPEADASEAYVKFTVKRGEDLSAYFASDDELYATFLSNQNVLKTESAEGGSYMALPVDGFSVTDKITRNTDIVVSYGRVVSPARYVIQYINGETGADIAAPVFGFDEAGKKITPTVLTITGYTAPSDAPKEVELKEGETALIRLMYSANEQVVYTSEVIYTEGDTVYNDIINQIGQAYTVDQGAGNAANPGGEENLVAVEEAETPLDNMTLDNNNDLVEIDETETPLANQTLGNTAFFAVIAGLVVLAAAAVAFTLKAKKKAKE